MSESHASPKSAAHTASHAHAVPHARNMIRRRLRTGAFGNFLGLAFLTVAPSANLLRHLLLFLRARAIFAGSNIFLPVRLVTSLASLTPLSFLALMASRSCLATAFAASALSGVTALPAIALLPITLASLAAMARHRCLASAAAASALPGVTALPAMALLPIALASLAAMAGRCCLASATAASAVAGVTALAAMASRSRVASAAPRFTVTSRRCTGDHDYGGNGGYSKKNSKLLLHPSTPLC